MSAHLREYGATRTTPFPDLVFTVAGAGASARRAVGATPLDLADAGVAIIWTGKCGRTPSGRERLPHHATVMAACDVRRLMALDVERWTGGGS